MFASSIILLLQLQVLSPNSALIADSQPAARHVSFDASPLAKKPQLAWPRLREFDLFELGERQPASVSFLPGQTQPTMIATPGSHSEPATAEVDLESVEGADPSAFLPQRKTDKQEYVWYALALAGHGAAAFDAWSTRRVVGSGRGHEANPLLRPFAGSGVLYAAVQVGPTLADHLGRRMRTSQRRWARTLWWVPQVASTACSIIAGVHNLGVYRRSAPGPAQ
jgi:hypothetical protein